MKQLIKTGVVTGTGAAITVPLGFVPDHVRIVNITDGDQVDEWFKGMAAGTSIQINTAVAARSTNGVSAFAGNSNTPAGFVIGSGISESGKQLRYVAVRGDD